MSKKPLPLKAEAFFQKSAERELIEIFDLWCRNNKFEDFVRRHKNKLRKKLRLRDREQLRDNFVEVNVAYLLSKACFNLDYEKYGVRENNPDFYCTDGSVSFNVEVRRIRPTDMEAELKQFESYVRKDVCKVPSSLSFRINTQSIFWKSKTLSKNEIKSLIIELRKKEKEVIDIIMKKIVEQDHDLKTDEIKEFSLGYLLPGLGFELGKPQGKTDHSYTSDNGASSGVTYTQEEYKKYGDAICEKLHQMKENAINVLFLIVDSSTHEENDLTKAIDELLKQMNGKNDDFFSNKKIKGLNSINDFIRKFSLISAIVVRTTWLSSNKSRNLVWLNPNATTKISLPKSLEEQFSVLN